MFPRAGEAVWWLTSSSSVYVVEDPERAGDALLTSAMDDLHHHVVPGSCAFGRLMC
jgi:hypothetical protein